MVASESGHRGPFATRLAALCGPRPLVFLASAVLALVLVGAFSYVTLSSQAQSRRQARAQFQVEGAVTARLTSSLFSSSSQTTGVQPAKAFSRVDVSLAELDELARRSHLQYAMIFGPDGSILAASSGATAAARKLTPGIARSGQALAGTTWLSNILPQGGGATNVVELMVPFQTPFGRRVQVEGFDVALLSSFLGDTLRQPGASSRLGYLIDGHGRVIASSETTRRSGEAESEFAHLLRARCAALLHLGWGCPVGLAGGAERADQRAVSVAGGIAVTCAFGCDRRVWPSVSRQSLVLSAVTDLGSAPGRTKRPTGGRKRDVGGSGGGAHCGKRAAGAGAGAVQRGVGTVCLGRVARPAGAAAKNPHVLRSAGEAAGRRVAGRVGIGRGAYSGRGAADAAPDRRLASVRARIQQERVFQPTDLGEVVEGVVEISNRGSSSWVPRSTSISCRWSMATPYRCASCFRT
jgi:hypothetical protein